LKLVDIAHAFIKVKNDIKCFLYPGYLLEQCVKTWQFFRFYFDFWQKWLNYDFFNEFKKSPNGENSP
jgi:hypothetical protein